jgi:hypothetical protein
MKGSWLEGLKFCEISAASTLNSFLQYYKTYQNMEKY